MTIVKVTSPQNFGKNASPICNDGKKLDVNQLHCLGVKEIHSSILLFWVKKDCFWASRSDFLKVNVIRIYIQKKILKAATSNDEKLFAIERGISNV